MFKTGHTLAKLCAVCTTWQNVCKVFPVCKHAPKDAHVPEEISRPAPQIPTGPSTGKKWAWHSDRHCVTHWSLTGEGTPGAVEKRELDEYDAAIIRTDASRIRTCALSDQRLKLAP
jgi:hypothetical protein